MEFSEEWKSIFPIGNVFMAPLLLSGPSSKPILGPIFFNPKPLTLTPLFESPSLSPPLLDPPPQLSLSRFLSVATTPDSPVPLSTASSIASRFGLQHLFDAASSLAHNRLQFLRCPRRDAVVVFFSTGSNHDQVGFLLLSVRGKSLEAVGDKDGGVFVATRHLNQKILRILVNPVVEFEGDSLLPSAAVTVGYLLVCTMYAVHWFRVDVSGDDERPVVGYVGCKIFKSSPVAGACWSPHLPDESVVLLENGALFLFDLELKSYNGYYSGTRLKVSWDESADSGGYKWFGCEFSWHPRILIVARSDAVFLVDWRYDVCSVTCLVKIDMFRMYAPVEKECFLAFSKVVSDHFHYVLVSESMLFLCDVRKPFMPVLQWAHGLDKPHYIDVFRLSELRSNSRLNTHEWANESGFGIILGSFWTCEFGLFCYGPPLPASRGSIASEVSKISKSFYAWELPSALFLSGNECRCGSCLIREEFLKDTFPEWIDWQQKKDIVLGFCILSNDLSSKLFDLDEFGGFTLIRLMSSGKLELQRYYASWDLISKLDVTHADPLACIENNLFYSFVDEDYKFPRKYKYINFDYLSAYLNGNLSGFLDSSLTKPPKGPQEKEIFTSDFHEILCEKLKICGFSQLRTSPAISVVLNEIDMPTSIHEVAMRRMWASLPIELLQLAFSSYSEFLDVLLDQKKVALEFLLVPNLPQLPPFFLRKPSNRSSRWSHKVQQSEALVGPVLPLPILSTLHEFRNGCLNSLEDIDGFSSEVELSIRCNEVKQVAREMAMPDSTVKLHDDNDDDDGVSLADDRVDIWADSRKPKPFYLYHPVAIHSSTDSLRESNYVNEDDRFISLISKVHNKDSTRNEKVETVKQELFDDLCPIELKFDTAVLDFDSKELKAYNLLKSHFSQWQEEFNPYKRFCSQFILQNAFGPLVDKALQGHGENTVSNVIFARHLWLSVHCVYAMGFFFPYTSEVLGGHWLGKGREDCCYCLLSM